MDAVGPLRQRRADLRFGVAEHLLPALRVEDLARVLVVVPHAVARAFEGELPALLRGGQRPRGDTLVGDVAERDQARHRRRAGAAQGPSGEQHGARASVGPVQLQRQVAHGLPARQHPAHRVVGLGERHVGLGVNAVAELAEPLAAQALGRAGQHLAGRGIARDDAAVRADDEQPVADRRGHRTVEVFADAQALCRAHPLGDVVEHAQVLHHATLRVADRHHAQLVEELAAVAPSVGQHDGAGLFAGERLAQRDQARLVAIGALQKAAVAAEGLARASSRSGARRPG